MVAAYETYPNIVGLARTELKQCLTGGRSPMRSARRCREWRAAVYGGTQIEPREDSDYRFVGNILTCAAVSYLVLPEFGDRYLN